jgi:hypothetical protein
VKIRADRDGYPIEEDMEALRNWSGPVEEVDDVLDAVGDYLKECGYGSAKRYPKDGTEWRFATGGWSGCEEVIGAIPLLVQSLAWRSSHRGGLHIYGLEVLGE